MSTRYSTNGFVLHIEDQRDADRIFSVFTRDFGIMDVVGRGIRRIDSKLRGGIGLFSISRLEFIQGKHVKTLTDAIFLKKFNNVFESVPILETAYKVSQLASHFIRGQEPDERIWNLLVISFEKLNHLQLQAKSCELVYSYFFWNFISLLGYEPELQNCANCQKKLNPYELYFSNKEGGIICKSCYSQKQNALKIKSDTVKVLRLILKKDWEMLSRLRMENQLQNSLEEVSHYYYLYLKSNLSHDVKIG